MSSRVHAPTSSRARGDVRCLYRTIETSSAATAARRLRSLGEWQIRHVECLHVSRPQQLRHLARKAQEVQTRDEATPAAHRSTWRCRGSPPRDIRLGFVVAATDHRRTHHQRMDDLLAQRRHRAVRHHEDGVLFQRVRRAPRHQTRGLGQVDVIADAGPRDAPARRSPAATGRRCAAPPWVCQNSLAEVRA